MSSELGMGWKAAILSVNLDSDFDRHIDFPDGFLTLESFSIICTVGIGGHGALRRI
jgi:hypothetical protein